MTSQTRRWSRALSRAAAVSFTSALALLVFAGPARADIDVPLHEDHKNRTADYFSQECGPNDWTPPVPGKDGWHLVLPGDGAPNAKFVSIELTFKDNDGNLVEKNIPGDGVIVGEGKSAGKHAVIYTDAGWTLVDGTAKVTGETDKGPDKFVVSHTCVAPDESPSPSPSDSESPSPTPSDSESPSPSESPSVAPSDSESPGVSPSPTPPGGGLPVTGLAIGGIVLTGLGLVGAGAAMRLLRRKNDAETEDGDEPTDV